MDSQDTATFFCAMGSSIMAVYKKTKGNRAMPRKPIIAVFGPSHSSGVPEKDNRILASAEQLGRVIADKNGIVLTGGTGPSKAKPVKNRAILGACSSKSPPPWWV